MKHSEVKQLYTRTQELIAHLTDLRNTSFYVNYALARNLKALQTAVEIIDDSVDKRLSELEHKAYALGNRNHAAGLLLLSDDEQKERSLLYDDYLKGLEGENDFCKYYLDPTKCEDLKIEFSHMLTLTEYFKP